MLSIRPILIAFIFLTGTFSMTTANALNDLFTKENPWKPTWILETAGSSDEGLKQRQVQDVAFHENMIRLSAEGIRIYIQQTQKTGYTTLRIQKVEETQKGTLRGVRLQFPPGCPYEFTPLDYMTNVRHLNVHWQWLWAYDSPNPLGGVAIQNPETDEQFDENLLKIWVDEGLPHPKGEWTLDRARTWLKEWQEKFVDQSCLVVSAKHRQELEELADWAQKQGFKRIYLHTDTWREEYWPVQYSYLRVNPDVFPGGEADLNEFASGLKERGMGIALHGTCISIARADPDYVAEGIHPGLARWSRGRLVEGVTASTTTLKMRPDAGVQYPDQSGPNTPGPNDLPTFMNLRMFKVGDELVEAREVEVTGDGIWILKGCRRGAWESTATSHPVDLPIEGMIRGYGQCFVPDADHSLLVETTKAWGEFCTRNQVNHLECDALEIHATDPWGPRKFSWILTSQLELPSTSNTSSGRPLPFHIEYWFRGSQAVKNNHAVAGVAGGASLPLYAQDTVRMASGPYEILWKPAEMIGVGGGSFNVSYPWPMFGVTTELLNSHGMVPEIEKLISSWRGLLPTLSPEVRSQIRKEYNTYFNPAGKRSNQRASEILFRPNTNSITPLRIVGRLEGEIPWTFGQEFGPIVPRQYVQLEDPLYLENPWGAQIPEMVIRVLGTMTEMEEAGAAGDQPKDDADILAAYEAGTTHTQSIHPLHGSYHVWPSGAVKDGEAQSGVVEIRYIFQVEDPRLIEGARFTIQTDDHAAARMNGKRFFEAGGYDKAYFVDIQNLQRGNNVLEIRAENLGGPGALAASVQLIQEGKSILHSSSARWEGRIGNEPWTPLTELVAYGQGRWPESEPQLSKLGTNLMPTGSKISQTGDQTVTLSGDSLLVECNNNTDEAYVEVNQFPSWATALNMSEAQGLGLTVEGDGSGALLIVSLEGRGRRDYVIPIDFVGTREIEIPNGEVCWAEPEWSWQHQARFNYARVTGVKLGFGKVPAHTHAKVNVKNLRPLSPTPCIVSDLTVRLSDRAHLKIEGDVPSNHYLWYKEGDTIGLYDANWNHVQDLRVSMKAFEFATETFPLRMTGNVPEGTPWLELQFLVKGQPIVVE